MRVLVTGSSGSLASVAIPRLIAAGHTVVPFDLPDQDVLHVGAVERAGRHCQACVHLAGVKFADRGELAPLATVAANVQGTANVLDAFGAATVVASTCKAADPETVYGCSKLIAERLALNAGARVLRFVNVLGSAGSVTDIWNQVPDDRPLPVCDATRLFMTGDQVADMVVAALDWPAGRYGPADTSRRLVVELARELHPDREIEFVPLRRGDRRHERLLAECERARPWRPGVVQIVGQHDPPQLSQMVLVGAELVAA